MFKSIFVFITAICLVGCATTNPVVQDNSVVKNQISKLDEVYIYYNKPSYVALDLGGSSAAGMAGIFGFVGLLVAEGVNLANSVSYKERAEARSKELTSIFVSKEANIDLLQAEKIKSALVANGKTVKLIEISGVSGETLTLPADVEKPKSENGGMLILRNSLGYGAESATSSYKPYTTIEYALLDKTGKPIRSGKRVLRDSDPSYLTFEGLKQSEHEAFVALNTLTFRATDQILVDGLFISTTTP